jgi:polysaccharide biosynthesis protein PslH
MQVLIISPYFPYPLTNGSSIRLFYLLKSLSTKYEIDIVSFDNYLDNIDSNSFFRNIYLVEHNNFFEKCFNLLKFIYCKVPVRLRYLTSDKFEKQISDITNKNKYDLIELEHTESAYNLRNVNSSNPIILSLHNVCWLQYLRMFSFNKGIFSKTQSFYNYNTMLHWEPKVTSSFDKVIVVSETERLSLKLLNPTLEPVVIDNGVDAQGIRPFPRQGRKEEVLFVGTLGYAPNIYAAVYLLESVYPLLQRDFPDIKMVLIGRMPPKEIRLLADRPGVRLLDDVADLSPHYRLASVSTAPLLSGGGTRLKILEAMAYGVPVVASTVGCEGLDVEDEKDILIADDPAHFARQIGRLLSDSSLWNRISSNGRRLVEEKYDWGFLANKLGNLWKECIAKGRAS